MESEQNRSNKMKKPTDNGFLLVELLLAASILALVAAVVLGSFAASMRAMRSSDNKTRATMLLREKISDIDNSGVAAPDEGGFGDDAAGFRWRAMPADDPCDGDMCPVTVIVEWKERGAMHNVRTTAFASRKILKK
jgi:hypothetical protein